MRTDHLSAEMNSLTDKKSELRSKWLYCVLFAFLFVAMLLIVAVAEVTARFLEPRTEGFLTNVEDPRLGWLPKPGNYKIVTSEYSATYSISSLSMNDREFADADLQRANRILTLGDSHTFASAVSTFESWPKQLESQLFPNASTGIIWNAAVSGYSVGQYLERFRGLREKLHPTLILVGFSMATDLYDLIPPERGGFVYGDDLGRVYFDLDPSGELIEKIHVSNPTGFSDRSKPDKALSLQIRGFLEQFALYRRLKRSDLAIWIASHRPAGVSLWPGLDTALKKNLTEDDRYRWLLAERILGELVNEGREAGAKTVIVNIPYLAQIYDATWAASFGTRPDVYDRWIAGQRLSEMSKRIGALYIDTTDAFVTASRHRHKWLHWPLDAHPTPEGHGLIADVVAEALQKNNVVATGSIIKQ